MVVKTISSAVQKKREAVDFYIVLVLMEIHESRGDEKQLIDLEWPNLIYACRCGI